MGKAVNDSYREFEVENIFNKHLEFISGPMEGKSVRALPGIEAILGSRLEGLGYMHASQLYEHYLSLKKNKFIFQYWMEMLCNTCYTDSANVYFALEAWDQTYNA